MDEGQLPDRRIARTKEAIRDALTSLINEKGFEAITVSDIADRANINRGTFYLHYRDKFDLLDQIKAELMHDFTEIVSQAPQINLMAVGDDEEPMPVVVKIFEFLRDQASITHAVLSLTGEVSFKGQIKELIEMNLSRIGFFNYLKKEDWIVPQDFFITYIVSAHLGVIQEWMGNGCRESPRQIAIFLSRLSYYGPIYGLGIKKIPHD